MNKLMIIDGYNVIHQSDRYSGFDLDLEGSRLKLIEDMISYAAIFGPEVIIVFDGSGGWSDYTQAQFALGVKVLFTKKGQTADSAVEKIAHQAEATKEVTVVTADYEEQRAVFGKGALRKTPGELISEIAGLDVERSAAKDEPQKRLFIEDSLDEQTKDKLRKLR
ncbi:MAG: NYN domain-containing protein [Actinomycetota bacterium]|nr:NYN domain-containing protein [Actinomycetota bacterium]